MEYLKNPDDLILNTSQICDAIHLQKIWIPPDALDEPAIIDASVCHVINQRKHDKDDAEKKRREDAEKGVHGRRSRACSGWAWGQGHGLDGLVWAWGCGHGALSMPSKLTLSVLNV